LFSETPVEVSGGAPGAAQMTELRAAPASLPRTLSEQRLLDLRDAATFH